MKTSMCVKFPAQSLRLSAILSSDLSTVLLSSVWDRVTRDTVSAVALGAMAGQAR